ncbi:MAG: helix-turn-helix transcriptional regulator [Bacteroidetes bacterium]|nr:helix-turn-helix transcriptional regulator [Bacteroidota bacterium]
MGASKSQLFSKDQNDLAAVAKVLAHPARIAILEVLANKKACICNDIVDEVPLAQPTISQHLKELKNIGIIKGSIDGTSICYCLDNEVVVRMRNQISEYFNKLELSNGCC